MKAKKKPIEKLSPQDLGVDLTPRLEVFKYQEPPKRAGGSKVSWFQIQRFNKPPFLIFIKKVASVDELVAKLAEAGIKAVPT